MLAGWGREVTGNFSTRIKNYKMELKYLRSKRDSQSRIKFKESKKQLHMILNLREIFWRQRSKQLWLHSGDSNSKYFHASATSRCRTNKIQKLQNAEGRWLEWNEGLEELITGYFTELFQTSDADWEEVVKCVPITMTKNQNGELLRPVMEEEVKRALFQMNPDKFP